MLWPSYPAAAPLSDERKALRGRKVKYRERKSSKTRKGTKEGFRSEAEGHSFPKCIRGHVHITSAKFSYFLTSPLYDRLINLLSNDWDIYNWAIGHKETLEEFVNHVMDLLRQHARNEDRGGMLAALPRAFTFYLKPSRDEILPKFQLKWQKMFN